MQSKVESRVILHDLREICMLQVQEDSGVLISAVSGSQAARQDSRFCCPLNPALKCFEPTITCILGLLSR